MTPDDNFDNCSEVYGGIQYPPRVCVDYLSHDWKKEDDIWTSWKAMKTMSKKKEFSNGVRLENASWRTWAKQKYKLKTVNPEKLNWLKDSDVTWLYGPLHTAWSDHIVGSPKSPTTEDKLNLMQSSSTKSCLKKKSIAEILRPVLGGKYGSLLVKSHSDTQLYIYKKDREFELDSDCETSSTCSSETGPTTPTAEPTKSILLPTERGPNRKIQFNDHVEQFIAVESDDENSDDGIVLKKLEPAKLKEDRKYKNEYSALYSNHGRRRATASNSSNSSTSSSNSDTTSSTSTSTSTSKTSTSSTTQYSWMLDDDDDELGVEFLDFDLNNSSSTHNHSGDIIPPYNVPDEDQHSQDDDDDIVDKAVNIANGLVRWVFRGRIF